MLALYGFVYAEFGSLFIILTLMSLIFLNLGERKAGQLSAYSVFNNGFQRLLGTLTAEQFENELLHRNGGDQLFDDIHQHQQAANDENPRQVNRKRGKKLRRTYEARQQRRELREELQAFEDE